MLGEKDNTNLVSVVVADDHAIVRQGTLQLLEELDGVDVVAEADNGLSAIAAVKKHKPTLLMLDAAMPMARGIEVYSEARRWSPDTRIVLFTGFTSLNLLSDWLDAGVDGLLLKSCPPDEIKLCCSMVLNGSVYIAESVREMLAAETGGTTLTPREREVLSMIARGNSNNVIAERLNISPKTIEKHRASLMTKLGVHSVAELMVYALREGMLDEHKQL